MDKETFNIVLLAAFTFLSVITIAVISDNKQREHELKKYEILTSACKRG